MDTRLICLQIQIGNDHKSHCPWITSWRKKWQLFHSNRKSKKKCFDFCFSPRNPTAKPHSNFPRFFSFFYLIFDTGSTDPREWSDFGRSVDPILGREGGGRDYANHITTRPRGLSDLLTALRYNQAGVRLKCRFYAVTGPCNVLHFSHRKKKL